MKNLYRDRGFIISIALLITGLFSLIGYIYTVSQKVFWVILPIGVGIGIFAVGKLIQVTRSTFQYYKYMDYNIDATHRVSLYNFPNAVAVVDKERNIVWNNAIFAKNFFEVDAYTNGLDYITKESLDSLLKNGVQEICYGARFYDIHVRRPELNDVNDLFLIYFEDVTEYRKLQKEHELSKPVVMLVVIDNFDELMNTSRESEKAYISVQIDKLLEDYIAQTSGVLRKMSSSRFLVIVEERHIISLLDTRVKILDKAREIIIKDKITVTLSIGIGRTANSISESEKFAKQALDMALGRGGDQAAVKTENGFVFFGGLSKGVERHTKVRTRVIAHTLKDLIKQADKVYIMGHSYGDLDSIGSAIGISSAARRMGKQSYIVVDKSKNLATSLIDRFNGTESVKQFIHPSEARSSFTDDSLLIIVDTHNPEIIEDKVLYKHAKKVVVIDHHRKMVTHIDNAIIFFHEPFASSAAEMVAELLQHFGEAGEINAMEAESLLAGITLDTKNFVMRTGVRTFEAAAFLRKLGADTIAVRELFASSIESYQKKTKLVSSAEIYKNCAIALNDAVFDDMRIVVPQAADELLGITGVNASFVLYSTGNGDVAISARSMGKINVQVIMEAFGGGGHQTMSGALLKDTSVEKARLDLILQIDEYFRNNE